MSSVSGNLALQPAAIDREVAVHGEEIASGVTSPPTWRRSGACAPSSPAARAKAGASHQMWFGGCDEVAGLYQVLRRRTPHAAYQATPPPRMSRDLAEADLIPHFPDDRVTR